MSGVFALHLLVVAGGVILHMMPTAIPPIIGIATCKGTYPFHLSVSTLFTIHYWLYTIPMSWASKRRTAYGGGVFLFFTAIIGIPLAIWIYEPPACFDGKQNQGETAVYK